MEYLMWAGIVYVLGVMILIYMIVESDRDGDYLLYMMKDREERNGFLVFVFLWPIIIPLIVYVLVREKINPFKED